jgi:hypothetical protein
MARRNFINDMTGRTSRMDYTSKSNVVPEARAIDHAGERMGPTTEGATSDRRNSSPQRSPFSSASQPCDKAVTPESYGRARGMQPR